MPELVSRASILRRWTTVVFLAVVVGGVCGTADLASALEIRVRAQGELEVEVESAGTLVQVSGTLRDELGQPLPQRKLAITYKDTMTGRVEETQTVHTGRHGGFFARHELAPGQWDVVVEFDETEHVSGVKQKKMVTVEPRPVSLQAHAPSHVIAGDAPVFVDVRASIEQVGVTGDLRIRVNGTLVANLQLDRFGRGRGEISDALAPGTNRVEVRLPASRHRKAARTETTLRMSQAPEVEAEIEEVYERLERGLAVRGRIEDSSGAVGGIKVITTLWRKGAARGGEPGQGELRELAERQTGSTDRSAQKSRGRQKIVETDSTGAFRAFFPGDSLEDGVWRAKVRIVPDVGAPLETEVEPYELDHTFSRWVLNGFGILALVGGLLLLLHRLRQELMLRWRKRKERTAAERREQQAFEEEETIVPVSLPESTSDTTTGVASRRVTGVVWDRWREEPVEDAVLCFEASGEGEPVVVEAGGGGHFDSGDLPEGRYEVQVSAEGFVRGTFEVEVPHVGDLSNVRLDLISVSLKIRRLYQALVETLEGEDLWGQMSPSEIEQSIIDALESGGPDADEGYSRSDIARRLRERMAESDDELTPGRLVQLLTGIVEETYFSGRKYDEDVWRMARQLALELRETFARGDA